MTRQSLNLVDPHVMENGDVFDMFLQSYWYDNINGRLSTSTTVLKRAALGLI